VAGEGIFIGWGAVPRGREQKALAVFNENVAYWGSLQQAGRIESFDVVLLTPHGGDLAGFALLKGDPETLAEIRRSDEFLRHATRANLVVDGFGVVDAFSGEALGQQMALYQEQAAELA
jgi:hypothetical protein